MIQKTDVDLAIELWDLISLATILLSLAGFYWKLVIRLQATEIKVERMDIDLIENEKQHTKDIEYIHKKMNVKLDKIDDKVQKLLIELIKLKENNS